MEEVISTRRRGRLSFVSRRRGRRLGSLFSCKSFCVNCVVKAFFGQRKKSNVMYFLRCVQYCKNHVKFHLEFQYLEILFHLEKMIIFFYLFYACFVK